MRPAYLPGVGSFLLTDEGGEAGRRGHREGRVKEDLALDADATDEVLSEAVKGQVTGNRHAGSERSLGEVADNAATVAEVASNSSRQTTRFSTAYAHSTTGSGSIRSRSDPRTGRFAG